MSRSCRVTPRTGYMGQRYEVRAKRPPHDVPAGASTEEFVVGWTDQEDGGALVKMVERHPSWTGAKVIDLGPDDDEGNFDRKPAKGL